MLVLELHIKDSITDVYLVGEAGGRAITKGFLTVITMILEIVTQELLEICRINSVVT